MPANTDNTIVYDKVADVLYFNTSKIRSICNSKAVGNDEGCYLNLDSSGEIVGMQLLFAKEAGRVRWQAHRGEIPADIFDAIDAWYGKEGL